MPSSHQHTHWWQKSWRSPCTCFSWSSIWHSLAPNQLLLKRFCQFSPSSCKKNRPTRPRLNRVSCYSPVRTVPDQGKTLTGKGQPASICINYITKTGQILEPVCTFQGSFSLFFSWTCRHSTPKVLAPNLEGVFPVKFVRLLKFLQSPDTSEKCTAHPRWIRLTACCPSANVTTTNTNTILPMIGSLLHLGRSPSCPLDPSNWKRFTASI
jgi:hypothetical protein